LPPDRGRGKGRWWMSRAPEGRGVQPNRTSAAYSKRERGEGRRVARFPGISQADSEGEVTFQSKCPTPRKGEQKKKKKKKRRRWFAAAIFEGMKATVVGGWVDRGKRGKKGICCPLLPSDSPFPSPCSMSPARTKKGKGKGEKRSISRLCFRRILNHHTVSPKE